MFFPLPIFVSRRVEPQVPARKELRSREESALILLVLHINSPEGMPDLPDSSLVGANQIPLFSEIPRYLRK